jgi:DNA-binding NtrC family response regulator
MFARKLADSGNVTANNIHSRVVPFSSGKSSVAVLQYGGESFSLNGPSPAMAKLWSQLRRVAPYFRTALLTGEAGTGAEFAARALHDASPFRERPLRVFAADVAEHYFGESGPLVHRGNKGAFFLEEVEKLSAAAQQGLLQLLRLRGPRMACVIAFAQSDLRALVSGGSFSAELATSLGGLRIALPSLKERREDIPALVQTIVAKIAEQLGRSEPLLGADFMEAACDYAWPRNIDQMGEMLWWLMNHQLGMGFCREDFEAACVAYKPKQEALVQPLRLTKLEDIVQDHVRAVLLACNGNKQRAAEVLGISRSTLYRMLEASLPTMLQKTG